MLIIHLSISPRASLHHCSATAACTDACTTVRWCIMQLWNVQSKAGSKWTCLLCIRPTWSVWEKNVGSSARRSLAGRTGHGGDGAERPAKADRDQEHQMIKSRVRPHFSTSVCRDRFTINFFFICFFFLRYTSCAPLHGNRRFTPPISGSYDADGS